MRSFIFQKSLSILHSALSVGRSALRVWHSALSALRLTALSLAPYALRPPKLQRRRLCIKPIALRLTPFALCLIHNRSANAQSALPENPQLQQFLHTKELNTAHVGVYVYDDSSKKVIADYQSDKYFVPASNTKLFTLYAGMKYLGDSLVGIQYIQTDSEMIVLPSGDPSLLHPDFLSQPVVDFLKKTHKKISILPLGWHETALGPGWSWDDYNDDYSVERSQFPVYGNFIRWKQEKSAGRSNAAFEETPTVTSSPEISWEVRFSHDSLPKTFLVQRLTDSNVFTIRLGNETEITQDVPFVTNYLNSAILLLRDTLGKPVYIFHTSSKIYIISTIRHVFPGSIPDRRILFLFR